MCTDMDVGPESQPDPCPSPSKRPKSSLLDFSDSSGASSNGSSPKVTVMDLADKEVTLYRVGDEINQSCDPLEWWRCNGDRFIRLSCLARKLLCITATSVPSERLFSSAGNIVKRASLEPCNVVLSSQEFITMCIPSCNLIKL